MAGYNKIYCIGEGGGCGGSDGINPIYLQIWVGDGNRQWLEVHYFDRKIKPLGNVRVIIPREPDALVNLLDACIVFFPAFFKGCPSLMNIGIQLLDVERIDFDQNVNVPKGWAKLREEALPRFKELCIAEAELKICNAPSY